MKEPYCIEVGIDGGDIRGNTNAVLQEAVDRVAGMGGGIVRILPGVYAMHDSLHLRSGVSVQGSGGKTVLKKTACVKSKVIHYLGYGHYDVSVSEPDKFEIGMGVYITDERSGGFYSTVATVQWKRGSELGLNRMLNSDVIESRNARAVSVYPIISGCDVRDVRVSDIEIDGNKLENERINGCRGGGVFLLQADRIVLEGVRVRDYNGDGISFQQCRDVILEGCACTDNTGHGLHPGSGSVGVSMRNTLCSGNGEDGVFYCLRVSYSLCEGCVIKGNCGNGLSIGHRDTDAIIRDNRVEGNGRCGIYFRGDSYALTGNRTLIENNYIGGNGVRDGWAQIRVDSRVEDVHILGNTIEPGKGDAVFFNEPCRAVYVYENSVSGDAVAAAKRAYWAGIAFEQPERMLDAGPDAAPEGADWHLGKRKA